MRQADKVFYGVIAGLIIVCMAYLLMTLPGKSATDFQPADPRFCESLDRLEQSLTDHNAKFVEIDAEALLGLKGKGLGKVLLTTMDGDIVVGFERGGCMFGPIGLANVDGVGI
jgi:hypothetical protein